MKLAVIAPVPLQDKYAVTDYHMALTHLVLDPYMGARYSEVFITRRKLGHYVILDNSVVELGAAIKIETVIEAARRIGASEIILPDIFDDREATVYEAKRIVRHYKEELKPYKLMAVAQGKDMADWIECYCQLAAIPEIDVIGVPKRLHDKLGGDNPGRLAVLFQLHQQGIAEHYGKPVHLLGCNENPRDLAIAAAYPWVRGVDTIVPVLCGTLGIIFDPLRGMIMKRPPHKPDFASGMDFAEAVRNNIYLMQQWCNGIY